MPITINLTQGVVLQPSETRIGFAVILEVIKQEHPLIDMGLTPVVYKVVTDFGNVVELTDEELRSTFRHAYEAPEDIETRIKGQIARLQNVLRELV